MTELILNLTDATQRADLVGRIRQLRGLWRIVLEEQIGPRSVAQNRYYWKCIVTPLGERVREQDPLITDARIHLQLRRWLLTATVVDPATGEGREVVLSTAGLNSREFGEYLERCVWLLATRYDLVVPDPVLAEDEGGGDGVK